MAKTTNEDRQESVTGVRNHEQGSEVGLPVRIRLRHIDA